MLPATRLVIELHASSARSKQRGSSQRRRKNRLEVQLADWLEAIFWSCSCLRREILTPDAAVSRQSDSKDILLSWFWPRVPQAARLGLTWLRGTSRAVISAHSLTSEEKPCSHGIIDTVAASSYVDPMALPGELSQALAHAALRLTALGVFAAGRERLSRAPVASRESSGNSATTWYRGHTCAHAL